MTLNNILKKLYSVMFAFILAIDSIWSQQWVWSEIAEESDGSSIFSGIGGALLIFGIIWFISQFWGHDEEDKGTFEYEDERFDQIHDDINQFDLDDIYQKDKYSELSDIAGPYSTSIHNKNSTTGSRQETITDNAQQLIVDDVIYSSDMKTLIKCSTTKTGTFVIPDSVITIGNTAFARCKKLTSISIPKSVITIEDEAFSNCVNLTRILVPDSVTNIGRLAFIGCQKIDHLKLSNSLTAIKSSTFGGCKGLVSITIPNSVASIEKNAFFACWELKDVVVGSGVKVIDKYAFHRGDELSSIIIDKQNPIYDSRNNCNAIIVTATNTLIVGCKNTVIPKTVTSIGEEAFLHCDGLSEIVIPESVATIECGAFYGCSNLSFITSLATTAPTLGQYVFSEISNKGTLIIPKGSFNEYKVWITQLGDGWICAEAVK